LNNSKPSKYDGHITTHPAPKGIAALYLRPKCLGSAFPKNYWKAGAIILGGGQEHGMRAGTENVPYIVGMGRAAELIMERVLIPNEEGSNRSKDKQDCLRLHANALHMEAMRNRLLERLVDGLGSAFVRPNGPTDSKLRLPNTLSVGLKGVQSGKMLARLQDRVACSAGAACHSSGNTISSVLAAMKVPLEYASGTIRLSVGPYTRKDEVDVATDLIIAEVKRQLNNE